MTKHGDKSERDVGSTNIRIVRGQDRAPITRLVWPAGAFQQEAQIDMSLSILISH